MGYRLLADVVVAIHVAYVTFVVLGQAAILVGMVRRWAWVRRPWFRVTHLLAITIVASEALLAIPCPLTVWEDRLRRSSGQDVAEGTFLGRCLHNLIFYDFAPWAFTVCYVSFAVVVLATLVLFPPRWRRSTPE